jgi:hypothetical protein
MHWRECRKIRERNSRGAMSDLLFVNPIAIL